MAWPTSPSNGATYTNGGQTWVYTASERWDKQGAAPVVEKSSFYTFHAAETINPIASASRYKVTHT